MNKAIYIVEDDENIREMIRMALTSFSYEVTAFDNAEDALTAIRKAKPDMAIFDIMLPGLSGLDAIRAIRKNPATSDLPLVMLTAKGTELDKVTGLDCGADDYIAKPFGVMELGARIRALFRRAEKSEIPPSQSLVIVDLTINGQTREVSRDKKIIDLTFKEYELLYYLCLNAGLVLSRDRIMEAVWGYDFEGESRTLDMHIRSLRQKLGPAGVQLQTVRSVGYKVVAEEKR